MLFQVNGTRKQSGAILIYGKINQTKSEQIKKNI